jgi:hypothetical protein
MRGSWARARCVCRTSPKAKLEERA